MRNALWTLALGAVLVLCGYCARCGAGEATEATDAATVSIDVPARPAATVVLRVEVVQVVYHLEARPAVLDDKGKVLEPAIRAGQLRSVYVKWRGPKGQRHDERALNPADCAALLKRVKLGK